MRPHPLGQLRSQQGKFLAIFFCLAAALLGSAIHGSAQQPPANPAEELTLEQYKAELDRCANVVERPSEIPLLQNSLPSTWTVRVGDTAVAVPTEPIRSQLRQMQLRGGDPKQAARELRLLMSGMKQEAQELTRAQDQASPAKSRALLEDILKRKEFQGASGPGAAEILMSKITRWLAEMLGRLFSLLPRSARAGNIFVWGVIVLAFLALCFLGWNWLSSRPPAATRLPTSAIPQSARQWVEEALEAAARGDYRAALHCAYWGAIARLEDLGRLSRDRARTPRESLRLLDNQPGDHRLLHALTGIFERVWYGYRAASEADWMSARELLEKIGCLEASTAPTANS